MNNLVFIHGAGMDRTIWQPLISIVEDHDFNAHAVDLPGHGESTDNALTTIEKLTTWLLGTLDNETTLIGHSMGTLIALEAAAQAPDKINKLILLGTGLPMSVNPTLLEAARAKQSQVVETIVLYGHAWRGEPGIEPFADPAVVEEVRTRLTQSLENGTLYTDLNACNEYQNGLSAAEQIRCPVRLILGQEDRMTPPANTKELITRLQDVAVTTIPDCGHMILWEQPDTAYAALLTALTS